MYIQDQVSYDQLDDEHLSFFRAIGVDSIHLELRGGAPAAGRKGGTGSANTTLAQDLRAGRDCTDELAQALAAQGIRTRDDLADLGSDELSELVGIEEDAAGEIIMAARAHWFAE